MVVGYGVVFVRYEYGVDGLGFGFFCYLRFYYFIFGVIGYGEVFFSVSFVYEGSYVI